jgi:NADH:ubiquinone oxidoreductase subunit 3 (subunit A)
MTAAIVIVLCFLCFLGGFILNEVLRTKKEDKEKNTI